MKKILCLVSVVILGVACSSKSGQVKTGAAGEKVYYTSGQDTSSKKVGKYQIVDQEFDDMLAPESDYDKLSAYELQACGDTYLPPFEKAKKTQKAGKAAAAKTSAQSKNAKVTKNKKVTNNVTVHYVDAPAPVPPGKVSSTTTTTTTSSSSSSSSYAGGGSSYSSGSYSSGNSYGSAY